jgi:hypothetical protein
MFLGLPAPDPLVRGTYGSKPSVKQTWKKPWFILFCDFFDFLFFKNDLNVPSKRNKQKNLGKKNFFVGVLKVNDKNSRIQFRICTKMSQIFNTGLEVETMY